MKNYNKLFFKWGISLILILAFSYDSSAQTSPVLYQNTQQNPYKGHVRFGGGIGLGFGNGFFSGTISPSAIYQVNPQFAAGAGLNFTWASEKDFYNSTVVGGSIIGLFSPVPSLQFSAEFEESYVSRNYDRDIFQDENYWYPALFLGAGFNTGPVTAGIKYDVLYDSQKSIYGSGWVPFVRVYF